MNPIKRSFLFGLLAVTVLSAALVGCGKSGEDNPGKTDTPEQKKAREDKKG